MPDLAQRHIDAADRALARANDQLNRARAALERTGLVEDDRRLETVEDVLRELADPSGWLMAVSS
jgi:hypothetical protein